MGDGVEGTRRARVVWLVPAATLVVFAALTVVVSSQQVSLRRALLRAHATEVCFQASRRLGMFVDSRLHVAEVFALRWATHEGRDFSRRRFEEFGAVVVASTPGFLSMRLHAPDRRRAWAIPASLGPTEDRHTGEQARAVAAARETGGVALSAPVAAGEDRTLLFAGISLRREQEDLGTLVVELDAGALHDECFQDRIRRDFAFEVRDGASLIYRHAPDGEDLASIDAGVGAVESFPVRNRTWYLAVVPRAVQSDPSRWGSALPVAVLGLLLSLGLAVLAHVGLHRMDLYRKARDRAVSEVQARERAQHALGVSEARYRSVFDSASDGLVILEQGGRIVEANPAACIMHGRGPGGLEGLEYPELIVPELRHLWTELLEQLEAVGTARLESRHATRDGGAVDLEVRGTAFTHDAEARILVILTDVTELRRSEQRHAALSRKVLVAQEEERARISRELHDELGQVLTAIRFELAYLAKRLAAGDSGEKELSTVLPLVERAANELRRVCRGLRPPLLDDLGLEPAVQQLVEEFQERTGTAVDTRIDLEEGERSLPREVALCTYRVLQESLTNVGRHAEAARVSISLVRKGDRLLASVYDEGRGFELAALGTTASSGIVGMRERAFLVGGTVEIRSAPFQGTRVTLEIPLKETSSREEAS